MKPKKELIRVVRSPEGTVSIDPKGKLPGRGAYVCPDHACLKKALKTRALDRSLEVTLPPEVQEELQRQLEAAYGTE